MSSECEHYRESLNEYLDGTLREDERRRFEQHIARCQRCAAAVAAEQKLVEMLRALPQRPAPAALRERVLTRLGTTSQRTPLRQRVERLLAFPKLKVAMELAAVFVVVLVGWYLFNPNMFATKLEREVLKSKASTEEKAQPSQPYAAPERFSEKKEPLYLLDRAKQLGTTVSPQDQRTPAPGPPKERQIAPAAAAPAETRQTFDMPQSKSETPSVGAKQATTQIKEFASTNGYLGAETVPATPQIPHTELALKRAAEAETRDQKNVVKMIVSADKDLQQRRDVRVGDVARLRAEAPANVPSPAQSVYDVVKQFDQARVVVGYPILRGGEAVEGTAAGVSVEPRNIVLDLPSSEYERFVSKLKEAGFRVEVEQGDRALVVAGVSRPAATSPQSHLAYPSAAAAPAQMKQLESKAKALSPERKAVVSDEVVAARGAMRYKAEEPRIIRIEIVIEDRR